MGSRNRSRFDGEDRSRRSRDESYNYREGGNGMPENMGSSRQKVPLLHFTTDINPAIFSGPIPMSVSPSGNRNQYGGNFRNSDNYPHEHNSEDRKFSNRRDSYGYDDEERRPRRHDRDRYDRDRDYRGDERGRDRSRDRDRDRGRDRVRDRSYDRDDERRDRDRERVVSRERDWREEIPNNTLMVRGLDVSVTESEIREEVLRYGLQPKDIRLIREKGTGASRGFAFVEFQLLSEAVRWKELTKVLLLLFITFISFLITQLTSQVGIYTQEEDNSSWQ